MLGILLHALCAALYLALAFHFWRTRWADKKFAQTLAPQRFAAISQAFAWWERAWLLVAVAGHALLLADDVLGGGQFRFGFAHAPRPPIDANTPFSLSFVPSLNTVGIES